jgi:isopentenyl phosphate kinase
VTAAVGPVVTVKKSATFFRRLFQAAVEIIKKISPKASLFDFHGCGSFHRPPLSFFLVLFLSL